MQSGADFSLRRVHFRVISYEIHGGQTGNMSRFFSGFLGYFPADYHPIIASFFSIISPWGLRQP
jgi:hypothetical protein